MTRNEALAEARRRWDAARPTEWCGGGTSAYHGAEVHEVVSDGVPRCAVGYRESWPGCMSGFMERGSGATWEAAFEDVDRRTLASLLAETPEVRNSGYLDRRVDEAIARAGSVPAALAAARAVAPNARIGEMRGRGGGGR